MLTRYRPVPRTSPLSLFDAFFEGADPFAGFENRLFAQTHGPRFDLAENEDGYVLTADLPGLKPEELELTVEDGVLTLKGERKIEVPEGYQVRRSERGTMRFEKSYRLGDRIDGTAAEAKLADGVLTLTLPKRPEAKPRRIEVKS